MSLSLCGSDSQCEQKSTEHRTMRECIHIWSSWNNDKISEEIERAGVAVSLMEWKGSFLSLRLWFTLSDQCMRENGRKSWITPSSNVGKIANRKSVWAFFVTRGGGCGKSYAEYVARQGLLGGKRSRRCSCVASRAARFCTFVKKTQLSFVFWPYTPTSLPLCLLPPSLFFHILFSSSLIKEERKRGGKKTGQIGE